VEERCKSDRRHAFGREGLDQRRQHWSGRRPQQHRAKVRVYLRPAVQRTRPRGTVCNLGFHGGTTVITERGERVQGEA